jgi:hypothetical protein
MSKSSPRRPSVLCVIAVDLLPERSTGHLQDPSLFPVPRSTAALILVQIRLNTTRAPEAVTRHCNPSFMGNLFAKVSGKGLQIVSPFDPFQYFPWTFNICSNCICYLPTHLLFIIVCYCLIHIFRTVSSLTMTSILVESCHCKILNCWNIRKWVII